LFNKYKGRITSSYVDPPYNTGDDGFPYKDGFMSSSWLSMMLDRLSLSKKLMRKDGIQFIHIDFHELNHLYQLGKKIYGEENFISMFNVKVRHEARILKADKDTHEVIEQVLAFKTGYNSKGLNKQQVDNTSIDAYVYDVNFLKPPTETLTVDGWTVEVFKNGDYEIVKSPTPSLDKTKSIDIRGTIMQGNSTGRIYTNHLKGLNYPAGTMFKVLNMGDDYIGYRAIKTPEGKKKNATYYQGVPKDKEDLKDIPYCTFLDFEKSFNNARKEAPVDFNNGKKPIEFLQNFIDFSRRGEDGYYLDFFAGSGSLGHAIINYNKENETDFKFILAEMADYFNTKTLPTVKCAAFSTQWSDQKPLNDGGLSQIFQYIKLEQYEDTLNNIEIHTTAPQLSFLENIRYQLIHGTKGSDSLINLEKFTKPFDYTMKIVQQNEPKDTVIDLVTTFNFLLGIEVQRYVLAKNNGLDYKVVIGKKGLQQYIIIWRNFDENSIDLKAEREFITKQDWYNTSAFVFCNGDNAFSAHPIEPEFIRLMNEPVL
jgi:adenine-specific DNA-methyltransferase